MITISHIYWIWIVLVQILVIILKKQKVDEMGITLRIGVHEMGIKTVDKMGIHEMGIRRFDVC